MPTNRTRIKRAVRSRVTDEARAIYAEALALLVMKARLNPVSGSLSVHFQAIVPGCPRNFVKCCARASAGVRRHCRRGPADTRADGRRAVSIKWSRGMRTGPPEGGGDMPTTPADR
jgi:hypothetical protein